MDTHLYPQGNIVENASRVLIKREMEEVLNCPRCNSSNTKFCYYNNYSLTQPRYFCKTCRRYWTKGGSLRNVPVGGAPRKNKFQNPNSISNLNTNSNPNLIPNPNPNYNPNKNHSIMHAPHDLNLAFSPFSHPAYGMDASNIVNLLHEYKPQKTLKFSVDGFPFEDLGQQSRGNHGTNSSNPNGGYWNDGMMGGGS